VDGKLQIQSVSTVGQNGNVRLQSVLGGAKRFLKFFTITGKTESMVKNNNDVDLEIGN